MPAWASGSAGAAMKNYGLVVDSVNVSVFE
jgi:hypothetical protein